MDCRYCGGKVDYDPEPDGSCEYFCQHCGWRLIAPSDAGIKEARKELGTTEKLAVADIANVILLVQGGLVDVYCDRQDVRVILCDWDLDPSKGLSIQLDCRMVSMQLHDPPSEATDQLCQDILAGVRKIILERRKQEQKEEEEEEEENECQHPSDS